MASYSNVDIKKFEEVKQITSAAHNLRQIPSDNVDPKKSHLNKFYVGSPTMNFSEVVAEKLKRFKKIRKNARKTMNLVFSASPELFKDKKKAKLWEQKTFDFIVKEFGIENIVYAVVHHDELTPHFQVSVMCVDPAGKLNASHFFDGRKKCDEFTTRYNESVKDLGLKRDKGTKKSKPQSTQDFYNKVNEFEKFSKSIDENLAKFEKEISSRIGVVRVSTVMKFITPLYETLKRYKAKFLADENLVKEAEKQKQAYEDLKLKFEHLGLDPKMGFLECKNIGKLLETAIAEGKAEPSNEKKVVEVVPPLQQRQQKSIKPK